MFKSDYSIAKIDPEIFQSITAEANRQEDNIELIASENHVSPAVLAAQGSILTNKYAEGYPGKRYYGGCQYVDQVEQLAIDRAKTLFGAEHANVQPHSGSQANQAIYVSTLQPGDTVLGMSLAHGGHLTHGSPVNFSGKLYNFIAYGLDEEERLDYDQVAELAEKHRPKLLVAGASAYSLEINWARLREIADAIGAYLFVDMAHYAGLIAAGEYPNPVPHAHFVTTTTHKTLRGPRGGIILTKAEFAKMIDSAIFPCLQGGPLMHVIAAKAIALKEAAHPSFKQYAQQIKINAKAMAETLISRGLRIVSGGTESHMFLIDLQTKSITGKQAEAILGDVHITVNKNSIPNDPESPFVTSGIRIGTPAITTRGFTETECISLANLIADILKSPQDRQVQQNVCTQVSVLCKRLPVYQDHS